MFHNFLLALVGVPFALTVDALVDQVVYKNAMLLTHLSHWPSKVLFLNIGAHLFHLTLVVKSDAPAMVLLSRVQASSVNPNRDISALVSSSLDDAAVVEITVGVVNIVHPMDLDNVVRDLRIVYL